MIRRKLVSMFAAAAMLAAGAACQSTPPAETYEAGPDARRYPVTGVVQAVERDTRQLSVSHDEIPGLMKAMTMSFSVKDAWVLEAAGVGDRLSATLVLDGARSWLENVALTRTEDAGGGAPAGSVGSSGVGPAPGTPLPAVALVDQAGRPVTAATFAGRLAIYTFVYTRCPVPDYCPLIMSRLNDVSERLRAAGMRDDVQIVAITVDPEYDTPKVLEAFGRRMIQGEGDEPFRRWSLLTGTPAAVREWAALFQLEYMPEQGEIVHGLRTAIVDRTGRVVTTFRGNDWTVQQLLAALPS